jgi:formate dehydrogenase maturation protein FdhE
MGRGDVPQTVAAAINEGWQWVRVKCVYCRQSARIDLSGRSGVEGQRVVKVGMT